MLERISVILLLCLLVAAVGLTYYTVTTHKVVLKSDVAELRDELWDDLSANAVKKENLDSLQAKVEENKKICKELESVTVTSEELKQQTITDIKAENVVNILEAKGLILRELDCLPSDEYKDTSYEEFADDVKSFAISQIAGKIANPVASKVVEHILTDSHDNMMNDGISFDSFLADAKVGVSNEVQSTIHSKTQIFEDMYAAYTDDSDLSKEYLGHLSAGEAQKAISELQPYLEKDEMSVNDYETMVTLFNNYSNISHTVSIGTNEQLNELFEVYCNNVKQLEMLGEE